VTADSHHPHPHPHLPIDPDLDAEVDEAGDADVIDGAPGPRAPLPPVRRPFAHITTAVAVFVGGCFGGLARYAVGRRWPTAPTQFPWDIFWVNVSGALALAVLVGWLLELPRPRWFLRPALGTGFLGAFTTFSALVTSTDRLVAQNHPVAAAAYLIASVLGGLAATISGLLLGRWCAAHGRG
jgi:CrcB protein